MWSVMYVNEWQETSNMAGNWHRQWTTTELVQCPPPLPWSGSCQRWHVLTTNFCTSMSDRDHMRERMLKAFSQNTLCHTDQDFFCIYNKCTGLEELHYFALKTVLNFFFTPLSSYVFATHVLCILLLMFFIAATSQRCEMKASKGKTVVLSCFLLLNSYIV